MAKYGHNSADALHVMIEAKKLAYADMYQYVGDPRFTPDPGRGDVSKDLATERAKLIEMDKAACQVFPPISSRRSTRTATTTIYLSTIDKDGNIVSLIQSNYCRLRHRHGRARRSASPSITAARLSSSTPGQPNSLAGHKRPLHTIIPAFMEKGDIHIGFGIMGGWNQAQAHAQFVANVVDFGMNVQAALERPRFTKATFEGCDVEMEETVPAAVRADLTAAATRSICSSRSPSP